MVPVSSTYAEMRSFNLVALAMSIGLAQGQVHFCDVNRRPNWGDCQYAPTFGVAA
jgi:hypothetical protein